MSGEILLEDTLKQQIAAFVKEIKYRQQMFRYKVIKRSAPADEDIVQSF